MIFVNVENAMTVDPFVEPFWHCVAALDVGSVGGGPHRPPRRDAQPVRRGPDGEGAPRARARAGGVCRQQGQGSVSLIRTFLLIPSNSLTPHGGFVIRCSSTDFLVLL